MKAAVLGAGVIGAGWAARFVLNGWDVDVYDPAPGVAASVRHTLDLARPALQQLTDAPGLPEGELRFVPSIAAAVAGADWIQESGPERLASKQAMIRAAQAVAPDTPLASSTSGLRPSVLQSGMTNPRSVLVAHPFNPVYLLPLVEVVGTDTNEPDLIETATRTLTGIGMQPLRVRREIDAHIADRLLEAVWREALWLVRDGIATTGEVDDAIRLGFGLRWAQMGLFETYRIGGGAAGMRHFLEQFGPALEWPWSRLTDVPALDEELITRIVAQSDAQADGRSIEELIAERDANLVAIIAALKARNTGAGAVYNAHDARLRDAAR